MKILLSGGGTIGSVSPLIAIYEEIKRQKPAAEFLWLATRRGLEHDLIKSYNIPVRSIFAGKFRRYFSWQNFFDPVLVLLGFFQSLKVIFQFKPDLILSAGSFVSVPTVWAGRLLGAPALIHQQDVLPGLANKLMAKSAKIITATFEKSKSDFPEKKTIITGNPVRSEIFEAKKEEAYAFFKLEPAIPTILVMGGGTGATAINNLVLASLDQLVQFCQVIHLTGGRIDQLAEHPRYRSYDFLTSQIKYAYAAADLAVSRAGMSALSELAATQKPTIVIPIPNSHQLYNAIEFAKNNAAIMVEEKNLTPASFTAGVKELLADPARLLNLGHNIGQLIPAEATQKIVRIIFKFCGE